METMAAGLLILDKEGRITHMNPAAERILRVNAATIAGNDLRGVLKNRTILKALERDEELQYSEIILRESASRLRCLASLKPIYNPAGLRVGCVLTLRELRIISPFASGPFLGVNCAAIPMDLMESELFGYEAGTFTGGLKNGKSGKLELANGGTLLLDEINGMSLGMQAIMLRVLEERSFQRLGGRDHIRLETRIIATVNTDLQKEIQAGNFRGDLYYRLNVLEIVVPPLRERPEDIEMLIRWFITTAAEKIHRPVDGISPEALDYLQRQDWPGNVPRIIFGSGGWGQVEGAVRIGQ